MAKGKGFDLVVHKRDRKGKIISVNPYRLMCRGNKKLFERPPGSGNLYYANGTLAEAGEEMKKQMAEDEAKKAAKNEDLEKLQAEVNAMKEQMKVPAPKKPLVDLSKVKDNGSAKA